MAGEYSDRRLVQLFGGTVEFFFGPPFISTDHVTVYVSHVLQVLGTDYTWDAEFKNITFSVAPSVGESIIIKRRTPHEERMVDYTEGAYVTDANLDQQTNQLMYGQQEDQAVASGRTFLLEYTTAANGFLDLTFPGLGEDWNAVEVEFEAVQSTTSSSDIRIQPFNGGSTPADTAYESSENLAGTWSTRAGFYTSQGPDSAARDGLYGSIRFQLDNANGVWRAHGHLSWGVFNVMIPVELFALSENAYDWDDIAGFWITCPGQSIKGTVRLWGLN